VVCHRLHAYLSVITYRSLGNRIGSVTKCFLIRADKPICIENRPIQRSRQLRGRKLLDSMYLPQPVLALQFAWK
jgi:hypothetical protein